MRAMPYGGGARLDMESLLLRGIEAPERRSAVTGRHSEAPHPSGGHLTNGALDVERTQAYSGLCRRATVSEEDCVSWRAIDRRLAATLRRNARDSPSAQQAQKDF